MKVETKLRNRYKDDPQEVQDYMFGLLDKLINDYGFIDQSWTVQLDMIRDWYVMYIDAIANLRKQGVTYMTSDEKVVQNPNFKIMDTCSKNINAILRTFATDPVAKARMNYLKQRACVEQDDEQVLENMLS